MLDKRGKVKTIMYSEKDVIHIKLLNGTKLNGPISRIENELFYIGQKKIQLDSVKTVHVYKHQSFFNPLGRFLMVGSIAYLGIDTFNRLINADHPLIEEESVKASAYLFIGSIICRELIHRRYKISEKRPLKVIDISI
ncbi:MAG: hypothetical protein CMO34_06295 [Verrucomicrobia bacterium]|nr:hypothetical protein [Verrucomicrobiota bacterium]